MMVVREMTSRDLRSHMRRLGLSQSELAALLGFHPRSIARFVTGNAEVPTVVAIAVSLLTREMADQFLVGRLLDRRGEHR